MMNFVDLKERIATAYNPNLSKQERDFILDAINAAIPADNAELHDPGNYLGRIEQIWAYLSVDEGGEGVCAAPFGAMTLPLIAADKRRLEQLKPTARALVHTFGKPVRLVRFKQREDIELIGPEMK
jgi:hypothetical protein